MEDFIEAFNNYRAAFYSTLDLIYVNKSINRWYRLGCHWINIGLPNYVTTEKKPDNRCEIRDTCNERSIVIIRLKLVKGSADNELLAT